MPIGSSDGSYHEDAFDHVANTQISPIDRVNFGFEDAKKNTLDPEPVAPAVSNSSRVQQGFTDIENAYKTGEMDTQYVGWNPGGDSAQKVNPITQRPAQSNSDNGLPDYIPPSNPNVPNITVRPDPNNNQPPPLPSLETPAAKDLHPLTLLANNLAQAMPAAQQQPQIGTGKTLNVDLSDLSGIMSTLRGLPIDWEKFRRSANVEDTRVQTGKDQAELVGGDTNAMDDYVKKYGRDKAIEQFLSTHNTNPLGVTPSSVQHMINHIIPEHIEDMRQKAVNSQDVKYMANFVDNEERYNSLRDGLSKWQEYLYGKPPTRREAEAKTRK